ncbi:MAG: biotin attachment protein [Desulfovibrio sp.]|jgi:hypothetical protein|nr:biotin attachment protein [Desulfovibrio sp.]
MVDIRAALEAIKASPYKEVRVLAPHTGVVRFAGDLAAGALVEGPGGLWKEKLGTRLATIERERNPQPITSPEKGQISRIRRELDGAFVQAGEELLLLRHYLSREEVLEEVLKQALFLFVAPERARYFFVPDVDIKIKVSGPKAVTVREGDDLFIMSRMKRETSLRYAGPGGVIYAVYFTHTRHVDAGRPLIGVCPPDLVAEIEDVVRRVQTEWQEQA